MQNQKQRSLDTGRVAKNYFSIKIKSLSPSIKRI